MTLSFPGISARFLSLTMLQTVLYRLGTVVNFNCIKLQTMKLVNFKILDLQKWKQLQKNPDQLCKIILRLQCNFP